MLNKHNWVQHSLALYLSIKWFSKLVKKWLWNKSFKNKYIWLKNNNLHIFEYNCTYRQIKIEIDKDKIPEFLLSRVLGRPDQSHFAKVVSLCGGQTRRQKEKKSLRLYNYSGSNVWVAPYRGNQSTRQTRYLMTKLQTPKPQRLLWEFSPKDCGQGTLLF